MKTPIHFLVVFLIATTFSGNAFGWGNRGHELISEMGASLVDKKTFENCHITKDQLTEHSTDPDVKWRRDRRRHPDEALAHFFHVDKQPDDWKKRTEPADKTQGFLVYRITKWIEDAKKERKFEDWGELSETLYGLVHYVGDLAMPLHLTWRHDGKEVGLPDLHSQWESKMVSRYEEDLRKMVAQRLKREKIPAHWRSMEMNDLIYNIAVQSQAKAQILFDKSAEALITPNVSARARKKNAISKQMLRFSKPKLFEHTGELAADQLALASRLWAHVFTKVCL